MIVGELKLVDGKAVLTNTKTIEQSSLTSDCWLIQFDGLDACKTCPVRGKRDCGGGETLKRLKKEAR